MNGYELRYKITRFNWNAPGLGKKEEIKVILADSQKDAYAKFFKMTNSAKYLNDIHHELIDDEEIAGFKKWISDIRNYADNGGDMW